MPLLRSFVMFPLSSYSYSVSVFAPSAKWKAPAYECPDVTLSVTCTMWFVELRLTVRPLGEVRMEKTACCRFMANYLGMVKVSAYILKYIHLQINNFHLEEATFLDKITGTHNSRKGGFPYSSNKKMYQIPRPHDSILKLFLLRLNQIPKSIERILLLE